MDARIKHEPEGDELDLPFDLPMLVPDKDLISPTKGHPSSEDIA